ncbi:MAG: restriction endonuclease [Candidatus Aenigmatarchaeota archaeon]
MVNLYRRGRIGEKKVVAYLKSRGFRTLRRSKGSRGPYDIYGRKGKNKYYIQVKTGSARASSSEIRRLKSIAKQRGGTAVLIHRKKGRQKWKFFGHW